MYKLVMTARWEDALRALLGRAPRDQDRHEIWLRRGRKPFEELYARPLSAKDASQLGPQLARAFAEEQAENREAILGSQDKAPRAVREAAHRVEAQRALTAAIDELVMFVGFAGALATAVIAVVVSATAGVVTALVVLAGVYLVRAYGHRQACKSEPLLQITDGVGWALYYPTHYALDMQNAQDGLPATGTASVADLVEAAAQAAGEPGPDQDERVAKGAREHWELVRMVSALNSSRQIARALAARARVAAGLTYAESRRQLGLDDLPKRLNLPERLIPGGLKDLAEDQATRAYGLLMARAAIFSSLPGPSIEQLLRTPQSRLTDLTAIAALRTEVSNLLTVAELVSAGVWPASTPETDRWTVPKSRTLIALSALAGIALLLVGGLVRRSDPDNPIGAIFIAVGPLLVTGFPGKILGEAVTTSTVQRTSAAEGLSIS